MQKFFLFFIHKKQFTILLVVGLILFGGLSIISIPKESAPEVQIPMGVITTALPGAASLDIERLITDKIEEAINNVDDLKNLTSTSREGVSVVIAEFEAGADLDKALQNLRDEVSRVKNSLPQDATNPEVMEINLTDQPILMISIASDLPPASFTDLAEAVKSEIKSVSGVSRIEVSGSRKREVQVVADKNLLSAYGLSLSDLIATINSANVSSPIGQIITSGIEYSIRFEGEVETPETIDNLVVNSNSNRSIYIRDIASVTYGLEPEKTLSRFSIAGQPAQQSITLSVYKRSGGDITKISSDIRNRLEMLKDSTLQDAEFLISFDTGEMIKDDLKNLLTSGLQTIILVLIVLFVFIGWRESIVAAGAIPLSFLIAFIGLYYSGNTINFISLFSLILAIGILVDSGIVVTEAIHQKILEKKNGFEAARETIEEYGWPLIAGTMTTVAVFLPLFLLPGIVGEFVASIPFTVLFVLLASIFVALGILPLVASWSFKRENNSRRIDKMRENYNQKLRLWYGKNLYKLFSRRSWQKRLVGIILVVFLLSLILPLSGLVKSIFFPQSDIDYIFAEISMPPGTPLSETDLMTRAVEEILYDFDEVDSFISNVGSGSYFSDGQSGARYANITLNLKKDRRQTSLQVAELLRQKIATIKNADIKVSVPNAGPPVGSAIEIKFIGEDLNDLSKTSLIAENILKTIPGVREVTSSSADSATEFVLVIDRGKAAIYGITPAMVAQTLRSSVFGTVATTLKNQGDEDVEVLVKMDLSGDSYDFSAIPNTTLDHIFQIMIRSASGEIPLGTILEPTIKASNGTITRENQERLTTVSSQIADGAIPNDILSEFKSKMGTKNLPDGVRMVFSGEQEEMTESFNDMFKALIIGLLLMFAILILEFNSLRYTIYVLSTVPLSLIGVFVGLAISRQPLSFPAVLGFIALAGIVVNNAIILIDAINIQRRRRPNQSINEAVINASTSRLRPIILTTITTVAGMIPLVFASPIWGPLAFTIMFGLTFAVVITLVFVPTIYSLWPGKESEQDN